MRRYKIKFCLVESTLQTITCVDHSIIFITDITEIKKSSYLKSDNVEWNKNNNSDMNEQLNFFRIIGELEIRIEYHY